MEHFQASLLLLEIGASTCHWHKRNHVHIIRRSPTEHASGLQLAVRGLDGLFTVLLLAAGDLTTLPAKRSETLGEDGVRVVVASVNGIGVHSAQVLDLELQERGGELVGVTKFLGKFICGILLVHERMG